MNNPYGSLDEDEDPDPHERGSIFTNASNIRSRLRDSYGRFERDLFTVGKLVRENRWDVAQARNMYYQRVYYVGTTCVVEESAPHTRIVALRAFLYKISKKKKLQGAFTKEELNVLTELDKKLKKFYTDVMGSHDNRTSPARIKTERAGKEALDLIENSETYEKILGLQSDNS